MRKTNLTAGQTFWRERKFSRRYDDNGWWLHGVRYDGDQQISAGFEFLRITEIVETETLGPVALFCRWIVDPDGNEINNQWTPQRNQIEFRPTSRLMGSLRSTGMKLHPNSPMVAPEQPHRQLKRQLTPRNPNWSAADHRAAALPSNVVPFAQNKRWMM